MSAAEIADPLEVAEFLRLLQGHPGRWEGGKAKGVKAPLGELSAALAVGWTQRKLKALKRDPEFVSMMNEARTQFIESIESVVARKALEGVRWADELILMCQAPDRGWRPPMQRHEVKHTGQIDLGVVESVKEAVRATIEQPGAIAALQEAIMDAEVIEDAEDD